MPANSGNRASSYGSSNATMTEFPLLSRFAAGRVRGESPGPVRRRPMFARSRNGRVRFARPSLLPFTRSDAICEPQHPREAIPTRQLAESGSEDEQSRGRIDGVHVLPARVREIVQRHTRRQLVEPRHRGRVNAMPSAPARSAIRFACCASTRSASRPSLNRPLASPMLAGSRTFPPRCSAIAAAADTASVGLPETSGPPGQRVPASPRLRYEQSPARRRHERAPAAPRCAFRRAPSAERYPEIRCGGPSSRRFDLRSVRAEPTPSSRTLNRDRAMDRSLAAQQTDPRWRRRIARTCRRTAQKERSQIVRNDSHPPDRERCWRERVQVVMSM